MIFPIVALLATLTLVQPMASKPVTNHTKLYAVIVDTSAFWFNYRHNSNALSIYTLLKQSGVPDDQIILMLADDVACNPRNPHAGRVFNTDDAVSRRNVYGEHVEVDFRGSEVTVDTFFRLLTDRLPHGTPRSKRLLTDERSNVLLFMTGHGGENFLKFQDSEEINAHDLADAIGQMHERRRFHNMLVMIDTCQADTMFDQITAPNVVTIASSSRGESSYSYHVDDEIGVAVIDRFTFAALEFMSKALLGVQPDSTLADFADSWDVDFLHSKPVLDTHRLARLPEQVRLADFFTNRQSAVNVTEYPVFAVGATEGGLKRPAWAVGNARLVIDKSTVPAPLPLAMRSIKL